jgi:hypothetical protein
MPYEHDSKNYQLNDLHQAMEYRQDGKPQLRVGLQADRVVLEGDVYVSQVEISNDVGNPIPVSATTAANTATNPIYTLVNTESSYSAAWHTQVARGKVAGVTPVSIIGYNALVPVSASYIPIWEVESVYTYPTVAQQMRLWSTSASDTNVTVTIVGLDSNYDIITEDLTLTNGITGVLTVNSYFRINSLQTKLTSTVNPVGAIHLGNTGKTTTYAYMAVGTGKSQAAIYTVPRGYTFYLTRVNVYCGSTTQGQTPGNVTYRVQTYSPTGIVNNVVQTPFSIAYETTRVTPRPYTEKTDIQWQVICTQSTPVGFQNEGLLIVNTAP